MALYRAILLTVLFIMVFLNIGLQTIVCTYSYVVWIEQINPTSVYSDKAYAACLIGDYIYVVGYDRMTMSAEFRIEKRYKYDGSLVRVWRYNPSLILDDVLFDCIVIDDKLYTIGVSHSFSAYGGFEFGKMVIAVLDKDLNLINLLYGPENTLGISIASDNRFIYIGAIQRYNNYYRWYIEKRDLELDIVANKSYAFRYTEVSDYLYSIMFNPKTNTLWAVGSIDGRWGIAILSVDLSIIKTVDSHLEGYATSISFDEYGYAYVSGIGIQGDRSIVGIVKYDPSGNEVKRVKGVYGFKVSYVNDDLYLFYTNPDKHIVYVFDKELQLQRMIPLNDNTRCKNSDVVGRVVSDGSTIFFATYVCLGDIGGDEAWVIYAIKPVRQIVYTTITTTEILTITITKTTVFTTINATTVVMPTTIAIDRVIPITIYVATASPLHTTIAIPITFTLYKNPHIVTLRETVYLMLPYTISTQQTVVSPFTETQTLITTVTTTMVIKEVYNNTVTVTIASRSNYDLIEMIIVLILLIIILLLIVRYRKS